MIKMFNNFNQEQYIRNLQNIKNETEQRLQQAMQYQNIPQNNTPSINQTFQLAPNQYNSNNDYDAKMAKSVEDVKNTLAMKTTLFINDSKETLWIKDVNGNVKTYTLQEVIELDEKDKKILELQKQIDELKGEMANGKNDIKYAAKELTKSKSTNVSAINVNNE